MWCAAVDDKSGIPTAQSVSCTIKDPAGNPEALSSLTSPALLHAAALSTNGDPGMAPLNQPSSTIAYQKFTSQDDLGHFLVDHYKIRTPKDLTSCEVCHR